MKKDINDCKLYEKIKLGNSALNTSMSFRFLDYD